MSNLALVITKSAKVMSSSCSVGIALQSECHKKNYKYQSQTLLSTDTLEDDDKELLHTGVKGECNSDVQLDTICSYHKYQFIDVYSRSFKSCCNVFDTHRRAV